MEKKIYHKHGYLIFLLLKKCRSHHSRPSLCFHRELTTSLYDQIYDRIQQEPGRLKRSYLLHDSGVITLILLVVKEVKEEKVGISPRAHTQANSHRCVLINDDLMESRQILPGFLVETSSKSQIASGLPMCQFGGGRQVCASVLVPCPCCENTGVLLQNNIKHSRQDKAILSLNKCPFQKLNTKQV